MNAASKILPKIVWIFCAVLALAGCSLYRPDLRQGDHITQAELNKLRPGMAKIQVAQILGNPALSPILEIDNWHYTYAFSKGLNRDKPLCFETLTLYFKGDSLQGYKSKTWHPANLPKQKP